MSGILILPSITWLQAFLGRIGSCKVCCIITVSWIEGLGDIHGYWIPFASASPIGSTSSTSEGTADIHGYPLPFTVPTASLRWTLHFCWRCTFPDGSENIDKNALIRNQINKRLLFSLLFGRDFVATFPHKLLIAKVRVIGLLSSWREACSVIWNYWWISSPDLESFNQYECCRYWSVELYFLGTGQSKGSDLFWFPAASKYGGRPHQNWCTRLLGLDFCSLSFDWTFWWGWASLDHMEHNSLAGFHHDKFRWWSAGDQVIARWWSGDNQVVIRW